MAATPTRAEPLAVVFYGDITLPNTYRLRDKADFPYRVIEVPSSASAAQKESALLAADAVVCVAFDHPARHAPRLRLVQTQSAGYELVNLQCVPERAALCNAFGHVRAIAEYTLMTMLMWTHQWKPVEDSFRAGSWKYSGAKYGPLRDELNVKTVGVLGLGQMGQAIAAHASAIGARVIGCARTPKPVPGVSEVYGLDRLDEFLGACDFVVVAIALAPETTGLIDAARLAAMKPGAVLVNVARGAIVSERDLYDALVAGTLAGAVIDVWWRYPTPEEPERRPSAYPFHELPNVFMTPHSSGWTEQMMDRRWDMVVANLRATWRGEPLINVVRPPVSAG